MVTTQLFTKNAFPQASIYEMIPKFLHTHLEQFGDKIEDIQKAIDYALSQNGKAGGMVMVAYDEQKKMVAALVINKTGMEGYIPENILVYIATHKNHRGMGIGKLLMLQALATCSGSIALHCEPENPAKKLYESLGFTSKYLEMRLNK